MFVRILKGWNREKYSILLLLGVNMKITQKGISSPTTISDANSSSTTGFVRRRRQKVHIKSSGPGTAGKASFLFRRELFVVFNQHNGNPTLTAFGPTTGDGGCRGKVGSDWRRL
jgi:hypothetical protein